LSSVLSKATLGIGIALALAAIVTIYVSAIASQRQVSSGTSSSSSSGTSTTSSQQTSNNIPKNQTSESNTGKSSQPITQISIPKGAAAQQVKIFYQPTPATVSGGAKITWTNEDVAPHTATADNNSFDTGIIQPGSSGSAIIKGQTTTTIPYHCTIHPWMKAGLIIASSGGGSGG
jgi:plastocyanin